MKTEYMTNSARREKYPKHGSKTSRAERRRKQRQIAKAQRKLAIAEHLKDNPTVKKFHFSH